MLEGHAGNGTGQQRDQVRLDEQVATLSGHARICSEMRSSAALCCPTCLLLALATQRGPAKPARP